MARAGQKISKTVKSPAGPALRVIPAGAPHLRPLKEHGIDLAGFASRRAPFAIDRTDFAYHLLLYVFRGRARLESDGRTQTMRAGELWLMPAHRPYRYEVGPPGWATMWFHLDDAGPWRKLGERGVRTLVPGWVERTRWALETILLEPQVARFPDTPRMLRACAEVVGVWVERRLGASADPREAEVRERLAALWERVHDDPARAWTVAELARALNVSPVQLHRFTAAHHGTTPMSMVKRLRMKHVEDLLLNSTAPLKTIAERVGYETPFSLSKAFKQHAGCSPGAYRKRMPARETE